MSQPGIREDPPYDRRVPPSPRRRRTGLLACLVLALSALVSCGEAAAPSPPASQAISAARKSPESVLLPAAQMPTVAGPWSGSTTGGDLQPVGPCTQASLGDIGAVSAARRTWTLDGSDATGVQAVGRFADNKSAWRAHEVLTSWHDACEQQVSGEVGPLVDVRLSRGVGQAFAVVDDGITIDVGIVRRGAFLSVVALRGDPDLPAGAARARLAVKRAAARF